MVSVHTHGYPLIPSGQVLVQSGSGLVRSGTSLVQFRSSSGRVQHLSSPLLVLFQSGLVRFLFGSCPVRSGPVRSGSSCGLVRSGPVPVWGGPVRFQFQSGLVRSGAGPIRGHEETGTNTTWVGQKLTDPIN